jgi:hypothetical protein
VQLFVYGNIYSRTHNNTYNNLLCWLFIRCIAVLNEWMNEWVLHSDDFILMQLANWMVCNRNITYFHMAKSVFTWTYNRTVIWIKQPSENAQTLCTSTIYLQYHMAFSLFYIWRWNDWCTKVLKSGKLCSFFFAFRHKEFPFSLNLARKTH